MPLRHQSYSRFRASNKRLLTAAEILQYSSALAAEELEFASAL
jgi:hypothetical protein